MLSDQESVNPPASPPPAPPTPPGVPPPPAPPGTPPGGGPPPGGDTPREPIPWEDRARLGLVKAAVETVKLMATTPRVAFERVGPKGDYASPLLWVALVSIVFGVMRWIIGLFVVTPFLAFMPEEVRDIIPEVGIAMMAGGFISVIVWPLFAIVGVFIGTAIFHVCLLLVGALGNSEGGFDATFRTVAYAWTAQIVRFIPLIGEIAAFIWMIILTVVGFSVLHRTSTGKAMLAVLLPVGLICVCMSIALLFAAGAIFGGLAQ